MRFNRFWGTKAVKDFAGANLAFSGTFSPKMYPQLPSNVLKILFGNGDVFRDVLNTHNMIPRYIFASVEHLKVKNHHPKKRVNYQNLRTGRIQYYVILLILGDDLSL